MGLQCMHQPVSASELGTKCLCNLTPALSHCNSHLSLLLLLSSELIFLSSFIYFILEAIKCQFLLISFLKPFYHNVQTEILLALLCSFIIAINRIILDTIY